MELTQKQAEDLAYLRGLDKIVLPDQYNYWVHNTLYIPAEDQDTLGKKKCWSEIPTDRFEVKGEMSFVERRRRIQEAAEYGTTPSNKYKSIDGGFPFQIRVIRPKMECIREVFDDEESRKRYQFAATGLGDGRHPKLPGKTELVVIGFATNDEISGEPIDIVYCVTVEDLPLLALKTKKILANEPKIALNTNITMDGVYAKEARVPTVLQKSKNLQRWVDMKVSLTKDGPTTTMLAGYKTEYYKNKNTAKTK